MRWDVHSVPPLPPGVAAGLLPCLAVCGLNYRHAYRCQAMAQASLAAGGEGHQESDAW